jgi:hypothetical protein
MTAAEETMLRAPRERAGRAAVGRRDRQAAGRHERRVHLIEPADQPVRATRATRHAARVGWVGRARRVAGQAQVWWTEGTERVAARARERRAGQAGAGRGSVGGQAGAGRGSVGGPAPTPAATVAPAAAVAPVRAVGGRRTPAGETEPAPRHLAAVTRRARWNEDLVTGWCSLLLVLGLYLDGPVPTPWHGVLYLGLGLTAWWILTRDQRAGSWSLRAVPAGYRVALVGVGLGLVAVAGDVVWHGRYGAEQGVARLVAPFHLVLFAGACLLGSSALRAAWSGPSPARVPGLKAFWPVVLSTTLLVAVTAYFFQDVSPLAGVPSAGRARVGGLLLHNLLFVAPVLLLLLRWQTPLGTFTVMAGSVAVALATRTGLGLVGLAGAAVLGGTAADVAVALLRPSPQRPWAARAVAVIAPAVAWTAYFAVLTVGYGVGREPALWVGSLLWACLSGFTLAWLMWPPAVPLTAWNRGRARPPSTTTPRAMPARMVGR